jgi:hypothetical protein
MAGKLSPSAVSQETPGIDGDAMRAVLDQELARFGDHAIDASMVLLTFDEPAEIALVPALSGSGR